jgi:proton-dependent oligopeptide transporter, POT family
MAQTDASAAAAPMDYAKIHQGRGLALLTLFFAEAWERFSYYGMRALLVLYFIKYFQYPPSEASTVYKLYTSLVYLTPLFGGLLADRYLGLRSAIVIGAVLMAIGHFLMAFPVENIVFIALAFLILGNGFFKPNMSTIVGRMYSPNDPGRDGAFTIFYMGINLGAFFSPLVCGWLQEKYGWDWGFGAAGIGMLLGLVIFLAGQKLVLKQVALAGNTINPSAKPDAAKTGDSKATEDENEPGATGAAGLISRFFPIVFGLFGGALSLYYVVQLVTGLSNAKPGQSKLQIFLSCIVPIVFGIVFNWMAFTLRTIKGAARDKSSAIFIFFLFAILFWMAFEQAGNALNIWADVNTDLTAPIIGAYPAVWFQSVNPFLIVTLGPVFAALWVFLAKRQMELSTAGKMFTAMLLISLSFVAMVVGAVAENATVTTQQVDAVPPSVELGKLHAGRLTYDAQKKELSARGVVADFVVNDALRPTVDKEYVDAVKKLEEGSAAATREKPVTLSLGKLAEGYVFPLPLEGEKAVVTSFDAATGAVTVIGAIDPPSRTRLINAGAQKEWRAAVEDLSKNSQKARVSSLWLFLSYFFATLGELCLSPVGLSMVTKLAPIRFGALFMGVWLLASSVAQYMGGALGELWGTVAPVSYFLIFVVVAAAGAVVLGGLIKPIKKMMHNVV